MNQIIGYVTTDEAIAFAVYAEALGLDVSALANVLLRREMQLCRLRNLPAPEAVERTVKITAHIKSETFKASFADHARQHGLRAGPAATRLFQAELKEQWLASSLGINDSDSN